MPNWCNNRLIVRGDEELLKEFLEKTTENGAFTFNKLVPRPAELDITSGSTVDNARAVIRAEDHGDWSGVDKYLGYPVWTKAALIENYMPLDEQRKKMLVHMKDGADMEQGKQSFINEEKYGCKDWHEWNNRNWGTKWDAAEAVIDNMGEEVEINFDTAWGPPIEWVQVVEQAFPDLSFSLHYDEPGMGFKGVYSRGRNQVIEY